MALVSEKRVVTTGTGASDHFFLPEKENGQDWALTATSGTWGDADLQTSADGVTWGDALDSAGVVNFVANKSVRVMGNMFYRLDVTTHSAAITLVAK